LTTPVIKANKTQIYIAPYITNESERIATLMSDDFIFQQDGTPVPYYKNVIVS